MISPTDKDIIEKSLTNALGSHCKIKQFEQVLGGDINQSYKVKTATNNYFIKTNSLSRHKLLSTEYTSLVRIKNSNTITTATPVAYGQTSNLSFLLLEYLDLSSHKQDPIQLGLQLAQMHSSYSDSGFGWEEDNYIGNTTQPNTRENNWTDFFQKHRLEHQYHLAKNNAAPMALLNALEKLIPNIKYFFTTYQPASSLLHGDLWAGNAGYLGDATPVIFDPASYYGDRETDIAMTELFGGFPEEFYQAYNNYLPLDSDYSIRKKLYKLYHVINHFNLFGAGYANQAKALSNELISYYD